MSAIKQYSQTNLFVQPTEDMHLVRWIDMKNYVESMTVAPVRVAILSDLAATYNSLALTLTTTLRFDDVDDITNLTVGDRVLVTGQTNARENGIYVITQLGNGAGVDTILTRTPDFNSGANIKQGLLIPVEEGTVNGGKKFKTIISASFVLDADDIDFEISLTSKVVKKTFDIIGDGTESTFTFTHNFNTLDVMAEIRDAVTGETIIAQVVKNTVNSCSVVMGVAPKTGEDFVLVLFAETITSN